MQKLMGIVVGALKALTLAIVVLGINGENHKSASMAEEDELFYSRQLMSGGVAEDLSSNSSSTNSPASHCFNFENLKVSFKRVDDQYPCLRTFCASLTTALECNQDENFLQGCAWCADQCVPYASYQQAFVRCVREAYVEFEPGRVNGEKIPGIIANPNQTSLFNAPAGDANQLDPFRYDVSIVSRGEGYRVPIHVHPFGGLINVLNGSNITMYLEGEPDQTGIQAGQYYRMPPMVKLATHCAGPTGYADQDIFVTNVCYPTWVVLEPEGYFVQDNEFVFTNNITCG